MVSTSKFDSPGRSTVAVVTGTEEVTKSAVSWAAIVAGAVAAAVHHAHSSPAGYGNRALRDLTMVWRGRVCHHSWGFSNHLAGGGSMAVVRPRRFHRG